MPECLPADQKAAQAHHACQQDDDLADENRRALFGLMNCVQVLRLGSVVFQTKPAEFMAAGACHVWAARNALDWNLAFGALVGHEDEIHKAQH